MRASKLVCLSISILVLGLCRDAAAHPMGNFSVNHYSKITLEGDRIRVRYIIDLAEIPTFQELQRANVSTTAVEWQARPASLSIERRYLPAGCGGPADDEDGLRLRGCVLIRPFS